MVFRIRALPKGLIEVRSEGVRGGRSRGKLHFGSGYGVYQGGRYTDVGDDGDDELLHSGARDVWWQQSLPVHTRPPRLNHQA